MVEKNIEKIVEALIFSSDKPISIGKMKDVLEDVDIESIKQGIIQIKDYYTVQDRSFELKEIAEGYQFVTKSEFATWLAKLYKKHHDKIRGATMETLAIIVYKQPITKAEIEAIRGVNVDGVVKTLLEKDLIKIKGRKEVAGRPLIYGTTEEFLIRFGLKDLDSLPPLKEFTEKDLDFDAEGITPLPAETNEVNNTGSDNNPTAAAAPEAEKEGDPIENKEAEG